MTKHNIIQKIVFSVRFIYQYLFMKNEERIPFIKRYLETIKGNPNIINKKILIVLLKRHNIDIENIISSALIDIINNDQSLVKI